MRLNCSLTLGCRVVVDVIIIAGLMALGYLNWRTYEDVDQLGQVVAEMLIDLGKKGILKVEVEDDDS